MLSVGPAVAPRVAAQTTQDSYHLNKDVAEACSFRNTRKCARLIARVWDRFASTALSALPSGFSRDGVFPEAAAPALLALNGFATPDLRPSGCGQLPVNREQLTRLVCNARDQLRPYGRTSWERENRRLEEVNRILVDAQCLPADALDVCPEKPVTVASAMPVEAEPVSTRSGDSPDPHRSETLASALRAENVQSPESPEIDATMGLANQGLSEPIVDLQERLIPSRLPRVLVVLQ